MVGQGTALSYAATNLLPAQALDLQDDLTVIEQQDVPGAHILNEIRIGNADTSLITVMGSERGIKYERLSRLEDHRTFSEGLDAYLRSLQIPHDSHVAAEL